LAEVTVLFLLISAGWLLVACFALIMCRVAALSDDSCASALADWIAVSRLAEQEDLFPDGSIVQRTPTDGRAPTSRLRGTRARAAPGIRIK
jgi:hypothetical protein